MKSEEKIVHYRKLGNEILDMIDNHNLKLTESEIMTGITTALVAYAIQISTKTSLLNYIDLIWDSAQEYTDGMD